jgi:ribosome assembly protein 1
MAALEDTWNFSPSKGNVVFCSAFDTWGFGLPKFVNLYVKRLGLNRGVLHKYLFEDYCFNDATKKISKYDSSDYSSKPMFASMVLDPLWNLYSACVVRGHVEQGAREFMSEFGVVLPPRDINVRDPRGTYVEYNTR